MSIEINVNDSDVWEALTRNCPNRPDPYGWPACECGKCVDGLILTRTGEKLARLFAKYNNQQKRMNGEGDAH